MRVLVFVFSFFISFSACAEVACETLVVSTRERIEAALDHVFERTDEVRADPVFAKLDRDLVEWLEGWLARLAPRARENLFQILNEAWVVDRFFPENLEEDFWEGTSGRVSYRDNSVRLIVNRGLLESEVSRHIFVHEVRHILGDRLDARSLRGVSKRSRASRERWLAIYRGEIASFREEYRYLGRNYGASDLLRVADLGVECQRLRSLVREKPWARFEDFKLTPDFEAVKTDEDWALIRALVKAEGDALLLMSLHDALSQSEVEYVKTRVALYRGDQEILSKYRDLKTRVRWGVLGGLAGVATPVLARWLFGL